ncbi:MAG: hypothetical protein JW837_03695 [Sedimentisphaerales bacterium]|nr:hypothetical protein [Sedimentisphaerales bacterium]
MNKTNAYFGLITLFTLIILSCGCVPENTLQWSKDGSVGLMNAKDALYLVDGTSGNLTEIEKENISSWPGISEDGSLIAYCQEIKCQSPAEGLEAIPPAQAKIIEEYSVIMKKRILETGPAMLGDNFPSLEDTKMNDEYRKWVIRYVCENADSELAAKIGEELVGKGKSNEISYYKLILANRNNLTDKKVIAVNILPMWQVRISPDNKYLSYIVIRNEEEHGNIGVHDLYVASLEENVPAALVSKNVALGYDWRDDSRALVYLHSEFEKSDETVLGTVKESVVADVNGTLLAEAVTSQDDDYFGSHNCDAKTKDLAGIAFIPWYKAQYGLGNRVYFASVIMSIPSTMHEDGRISLFCYDPATSTIANLLPAEVSQYSPETLYMFEVSPDGKKILIPASDNRLALYELGQENPVTIIKEEEGFGDDIPVFNPAWKGNNEISYLVSGQNSFLPAADANESGRKEMVIFGDDGSLHQVLSKSWPDELMKKF